MDQKIKAEGWPSLGFPRYHMPMFDQMKNLKDLTSMLGDPDQLREKVDQVQAELSRKTVEAEAGAGAVRVTVNGRFEVVNLELDPSMLAALSDGDDQASPDQSTTDKAMVEDLITAAVNEGIKRAQKMASDEMSQFAGGLNIPGLDQLTG